MTEARQQIGKPYLWGAAGPDAFDCSGLVNYCYAQSGVAALDPGWGHGPTANDLYEVYCDHLVSVSDLLPGDLVFYDYAWSPDYGTDRVPHVGVYTEASTVIDAEWASTVCENPWGWDPDWALFGRVRPEYWPGGDNTWGGAPVIGVGERDDGSLDPLIVNSYGANGGAAVIGAPSNYVHQWGPGNNGWIQDFGSDKAITHKTSHSWAVYVHGPIWDRYKQLGGPWAMDWPWDDAVDLGNGYEVQQFGDHPGHVDSWISDAPYWGDVTHDGIIGPVYDSFDQAIPAGGTALFQLKIKNYGQNTWPAGYVGLRIKGEHAADFRASDWAEPEAGVYIASTNTEDVPPQGTTIFSWHMQAPAEGVYPGVEAMLYSLDGQCYVPDVVTYNITVGTSPLPIGVGRREDGTKDQKFEECYARNGGAAVLGSPTSYVEPLGPPDSLGWVQHFGPDKAILRKDKSYAEACYTYGAIWQLYTGLGAPAGPSYAPLDWPYWKDHDDPYYSDTSYPPQLPLVDHPIPCGYQGYLVQNFIDTVPFDGWICEAPFWAGVTHDGALYPSDTYDPVMVAGQTERFRLLVKNDGQETWQPGYVLIRIKGTYAADFRAGDWWEPEGEVPGTVLIAGSVSEAVPPQGFAVLEWDMKAPDTPGLYGPGDTDLTVMLYSLDGRCYVANLFHYHATVIPAVPGPDYAISELRRTDGSGDRVQGDTIELSWETRNQGTVDAGSSSTTTIYLSADATIDTGDIVLYQDTVPALAAGAARPRTAALTIPFGILPPGASDHQYHIGAICDTGSSVSEINEGNNVAGGARIIVTEGSAYALTIGATGEGSVSAEGLTPDPDNPKVWHGLFAPDSLVTVVAAEAADHIWLGWKWDQDDRNRQTDVTVTRNKFVTADFRPIVIFSDVALDQWAATYIAYCAYAGIVQGYTQDDPATPENEATYRPDSSVGRGTMAIYIARAVAGGEEAVPVPAEGTQTFPDVPPTDPSWKYVEYCYAQHIVQGYPGGNYKPAVEVDRGHMAIYVARAMVAPQGDAGLPVPNPDSPIFPDVRADDPNWNWCYQHVQYLGNLEPPVVEGYWDGRYRPERLVRRDQMAKYVALAFDLPL